MTARWNLSKAIERNELPVGAVLTYKGRQDEEPREGVLTEKGTIRFVKEQGGEIFECGSLTAFVNSFIPRRYQASGWTLVYYKNELVNSYCISRPGYAKLKKKLEDKKRREEKKIELKRLMAEAEDAKEAKKFAWINGYSRYKNKADWLDEVGGEGRNIITPVAVSDRPVVTMTEDEVFKSNRMWYPQEVKMLTDSDCEEIFNEPTFKDVQTQTPVRRCEDINNLKRQLKKEKKKNKKLEKKKKNILFFFNKNSGDDNNEDGW